MNQSLPAAVNAQTAAGDQAGNRARFPPDCQGQIRPRAHARHYRGMPQHLAYEELTDLHGHVACRAYSPGQHRDRGPGPGRGGSVRGRATTTGRLPTASLTGQVPIVMTEEVAPRAILLSQRPHLDLGAEPDRRAAGHNRALRRDGRLPAPGNRSYSPGNGDRQRPNPGHTRLLQGIETDNQRSEGSKHLSASRYFRRQRDRNRLVSHLILKFKIESGFEKHR